MAEPSPSEAPSAPQDDDAAFEAFHDYRWDLDKDFLGGLVLALGGYHALARTASQADIIMHSRIFYYARIRGVTIPYGPYRTWLRGQLSDGRRPRIWEWDLLTALCNHRDSRMAHTGPQSPSPSSSSYSSPEAAAQRASGAGAEKDLWMQELLGDGASQAGAQADAAARGGGATPDASAPAWMVAAPRGDLYVDREAASANSDEGSGEVPYPERFAAIIKAVQSGEQIEGIVEIPDVVARNPTTTPFGKMTRPRKPWEKDLDVPGSTPDEGGNDLESNLDQSFPEQEDGVHQSG